MKIEKIGEPNKLAGEINLTPQQYLSLGKLIDFNKINDYQLVIIDTENHERTLVRMFCFNLNELGVQSYPNGKGKIFAFISKDDKKSMEIIKDEISILEEALK
jgi:hypothetical protein